MPFFRAWTANPGAVVERLFVLDDSVVESWWVDVFLDPLVLPILSKRPKFFRVNRTGSEVSRVVRARFVRGSGLSSLSIRCSSWVGRSSACESFGEGCFLSMVKNERERDFLFQ
jgi:hypothetical protein